MLENNININPKRTKISNERIYLIKQTLSSNAQLTRASVNVSAVPNFFVKSIILGLAFIPTAEINVATKKRVCNEMKD